MAAYKTPFCGYSVAFSPFEADRVAVATAQYFGVVGNGMLHVLQFGAGVTELFRAETQDGVYDVAWSEANQNQALVGCADGTLKLYDFAYPQPVLSLPGHTMEVFSVHWNYVDKVRLETAHGRLR
jgi:peroxin-7